MSEPPVIINDPTAEVGYLAQRSGLMAVGKHTAETVGETVAHGMGAVTPHTANQAGVIAGGLSGIGGLVTIGLAASVSAALTQMDYIHRKDNLKEMYKEELSSKLGKPAKTLSRDDLDTMAKTNSVIEEELKRSRRQRTFGVALSFVASMASLAIITIALPAVVAAVPALAAVSSTLLTGFSGFLVKGVVGLATYYTVKKPLHAVADKLFDIDQHTTNDRIVSIRKDRHMGKAISREEILSVFVAANPQLDKYIVQEYGKHYDDLSLDDKKAAVQELNQILPLDKLTMEINAGKVNVTELAFAVQGQESGVDHLLKPEAGRKKGLLSAMWDKITGKGTTIATVDEHFKLLPEGLTGAAGGNSMVMYDNPAPQQSYVSKLGLSQRDPSLAHVERVEQGRNEPSVPGIPQP